MRILTVRQPWAWAIIHGGKDVENRIRNIAGSYRGPVAIHAAQAWDDAVTWNSSWETVLAAMKTSGEEPFDAPWQIERGVIIGVVGLIDVHVARAAASGRLVDWADGTKPEEKCSPWAEWDAWHLVLANPRPLAEPISYKGALGLRRLDDEMIARIEAAIS